MRLGFNEYDALLRICSLAIPATDDPNLKASLQSAARKLAASRDAKRHMTKADRKNAVRSGGAVKSRVSRAPAVLEGV